MMTFAACFSSVLFRVTTQEISGAHQCKAVLLVVQQYCLLETKEGAWVNVRE